MSLLQSPGQGENINIGNVHEVNKYCSIVSTLALKTISIYLKLISAIQIFRWRFNIMFEKYFSKFCNGIYKVLKRSHKVSLAFIKNL